MVCPPLEGTASVGAGPAPPGLVPFPCLCGARSSRSEYQKSGSSSFQFPARTRSATQYWQANWPVPYCFYPPRSPEARPAPVKQPISCTHFNPRAKKARPQNRQAAGSSGYFNPRSPLGSGTARRTDRRDPTAVSTPVLLKAKRPESPHTGASLPANFSPRRKTAGMTAMMTLTPSQI